MMDKETGGPAFPSRGGMMFYVPETAHGEIEKAVAALDQQHAGLSLRDYFAAKALPAAMTICWADIGYTPIDGLNDMQKNARLAYQLADAMLAERAK